MLDACSINYEANSLHTLPLVQLSLNNSNGVLLYFDENNPTILNDQIPGVHYAFVCGFEEIASE